tara:strand:+ start:653 stop:880 length:228 start_codon:yes stop_codon:yes gene_type:complete
MLKLIIICITVGVCWFTAIYFSPYHTFVRECIYNEVYEFDLSREYCTWLYHEMTEENNTWLREMIRLLQGVNYEQ